MFLCFSKNKKKGDPYREAKRVGLVECGPVLHTVRERTEARVGVRRKQRNDVVRVQPTMGAVIVRAIPAIVGGKPRLLFCFVFDCVWGGGWGGREERGVCVQKHTQGHQGSTPTHNA
jgi:hypothetical protein